MVDSEYSTENYNSSKISIGTLMINPEILKFVPYYFNTKKCVKMRLKIAFCIKIYS